MIKRPIFLSRTVGTRCAVDRGVIHIQSMNWWFKFDLNGVISSIRVEMGIFVWEFRQCDSSSSRSLPVVECLVWSIGLISIIFYMEKPRGGGGGDGAPSV